MEETVKLEMTKAEAEQFEALIESCLERMRQTRIELDRDQEEIDWLKKQTRAKLDEIRRLVA
jgi:hypothetical protein